MMLKLINQSYFMSRCKLVRNFHSCCESSALNPSIKRWKTESSCNNRNQEDARGANVDPSDRYVQINCLKVSESVKMSNKGVRLNFVCEPVNESVRPNVRNSSSQVILGNTILPVTSLHPPIQQPQRIFHGNVYAVGYSDWSVDRISRSRNLIIRNFATSNKNLKRYIKPLARADPMNDFAFKELFGQDKNKPILKEFLNDILQITPITELNFEPNNNVPFNKDSKSSFMDVVCKLKNGFKVIIEVQVLKEHDFCDRIVHYGSRVYSGQLKSGEDYEIALPVITVAICNFVLFPQDIVPDYISDHRITHTESKTVLLPQLRFIFIELPKFTTPMIDKPSFARPADYWSFFFKYGHKLNSKHARDLGEKKPIMETALSALDYYTWTPEQQVEYDRMEAKSVSTRKLFDEGRLAGQEEGRLEGQQEVLSLTVEEFIKLKKQHDEEEK